MMSNATLTSPFNLDTLLAISSLEESTIKLKKRLLRVEDLISAGKVLYLLNCFSSKIEII